MAELDGVVHEVVEHLLYLDHIRIDVHLIACEDKLNGDQPFTAGSLEGHCCIFDNLVQVKGALVENHALGGEVVEREQGVGQLGQTVRFVEYYTDIFFMQFGRNRAVKHRFEIAAHGGER